MMRKKEDALPGLKRFAGAWSGKENIAHSLWSSSATAAATIENRIALSGRYLIQEYLQKCDGIVRYEWHSIIAWNRSTRVYTMYLFDSTGFSSDEPFEGKLAGRKLIFSQKGRNGHVRMVHEVLSDKKYKLTIAVSPDNQTWYTAMQNVYKPIRNLR
jgi:hypothetical protein